MQKTFEDAGLYLLGKTYGRFDGVVQFDTLGEAEAIDLQCEDKYAKNFMLDIDELIRERGAVMTRMREQGLTLADILTKEADFFLKWSVFFALSKSLEEAYREEICEELAERSERAREFEADEA